MKITNKGQKSFFTAIKQNKGMMYILCTCGELISLWA